MNALKTEHSNLEIDLEIDSVCPSDWKIFEITSLLNLLCKRVAMNQLTSYLNNKERLTEHQSGNKKLPSCEMLNVMMTDKALEVMDAKKLTLVVLLDLSKAFDGLDHSKLLAKLKTLGVGCTPLEWFGNYFSGHQQYVRIGGEASSLGAISHGVPQGSLLGPALFTIYINDLPNILKFGSLESYVDDLKLYLSFSVKDTCSVVQEINDHLSKIASWCCYNSLLINLDKTKLMLLGT